MTAGENAFTGDISGWDFAVDVVLSNGFSIRCQNLTFSGDLSGASLPAGESAMPINFENNNLTGLPRGAFR